MKNTKIYAEVLEKDALEQFNVAMSLSCNVQGALMPDAHSGYTLPIGGVIKSLNKIFPAYVGYDIGCGMCAIKLDITKEQLNLNDLKEKIVKVIPLGFNRHETPVDYMLKGGTIVAEKAFNDAGKYQLGTLGGGNHFLEIGVGNDNKIWIVIHSGSRGMGKKVAEHYMYLAALNNMDTIDYEKEFEAKHVQFKKHNPVKFEEAKKAYLLKQANKKIKLDLEAHNGFDLDSIDGQNYLSDMNCALEFALDNRKAMIYKVVEAMGNPKELMFINRNHNHAEVVDGNYIIHRKGATHAEDGMLGVIPGNMKDGSFIVKGKGNRDSMCSSSHGAGRVLSRNKAKAQLDLDEFHVQMEGIVTNHTDDTLDEAPGAYKNIYEVMELQKELVDVIDQVKPILNIKG